MKDTKAYYAARAAEAARLAELSKDDRVRSALEQFAEAYRERLTRVCSANNTSPYH